MTADSSLVTVVLSVATVASSIVQGVAVDGGQAGDRACSAASSLESLASADDSVDSALLRFSSSVSRLASASSSTSWADVTDCCKDTRSAATTFFSWAKEDSADCT